ncbi:hypothetical protein VOLCADRAFT_103943 [Volvox carteri f. nagariensis]|uniref:Uncharacterized protein n=1 Tax=Volvox carteri f. nagariensis TaxID=3068 RepID=D8TQ72_VOLCA|nr:uncharacterized protein VOLCADRAFT_103943 [Volvox carteri f. nagariensis]EFJ50353.1 hypothetical protein VOLCADRAFT_103943 [Volvox carteri f. nagariensis]|eukprot:XP_002948478.1 hypothetical protein VOLCADRAFT_103943 [Volvox carteri f. nagariensis]
MGSVNAVGVVLCCSSADGVGAKPAPAESSAPPAGSTRIASIPWTVQQTASRNARAGKCNASWVKFGAVCDVYRRSASGLSNPPHSRELHRGTPQVSGGPEHWLK